jgi:hypothetical protein
MQNAQLYRRRSQPAVFPAPETRCTKRTQSAEFLYKCGNELRPPTCCTKRTQSAEFFHKCGNEPNSDPGPTQPRPPNTSHQTNPITPDYSQSKAFTYAATQPGSPPAPRPPAPGPQPPAPAPDPRR